MTPDPGASPAPEGDFTETLDSLADLSFPTTTQDTQEVLSPRVNEDGFIIEKKDSRAAVETIPNTEMQPTPESSTTWADIVDRVPPVANPKAKREPRLQKGPRRRIVPAPSLIPALTRKKTKPAKVPTSKAAQLPRENSDDLEDMDRTSGSRKRKNNVQDSGGGSKHSA